MLPALPFIGGTIRVHGIMSQSTKWSSQKYALRMALLAGILGLSATFGCVPSDSPRASSAPATPASSTTATPQLPIASPLATPESPSSSAQPIMTAARVLPHTWSPDSALLAYWTFTPDEVNADFTYPPGTLHFYNARTGEQCRPPMNAGYPYFGRDPVKWLPNGRVRIHASDRDVEWTVCTNQFTAITGQKGEQGSVIGPNASLSPNGRRLATNSSVDSSQARTIVTDAQSGQTERVIEWRPSDGKGNLPAPTWLSDDAFLIHSTLDQGPLLVSLSKGITRVAPALFGVVVTPSQGALLAAQAATLKGTTTYHIALYSQGSESSLSKVLLYHSENDQVEALPFARFGAFSPDGRTLIGYDDGYRVWMRAVDPVSSTARLMATQRAHPFPTAWSHDGSKLAISSSTGIQVYSAPDGSLIGRWDTGDYAIYPSSWSPNSEFLAAQGYIPSGSEEALFVVEVH